MHNNPPITTETSTGPQNSRSSASSYSATGREGANERTPMLGIRPMTVEIDSTTVREDYYEEPLWHRLSSPLHPVFRKVHDHCHYEWIAALLSVITLLLLFVFVFYYNTPPVPVNCVTPFGQLLGENSGVMVFSNCRRDYQNMEEHYLFIKSLRVYSGVKWKSVEYARRFWLIAKHPGVAFEYVNSPVDIWTYVETAKDVNGKDLNLRKYPNSLTGKSISNISKDMKKQWLASKPQVGDLLIYDHSKKLPEGHVAVIVNVVPVSNINNGNDIFVKYYNVYLAEQNWDNRPWVEEEDLVTSSDNNEPRALYYSRMVLLKEDMTTHRMTIEDAGGMVLGWVRV
ncbi:D-alanyl-glycyl endopeptidase-like protein [Trypanosoma theileri]|uniref:D-alanyl-glycyl endopeptidase-like protein n=1 Tax=Trypanosoma theileri TaxID=67003 RepID=A0A1X0NRB4_9TRYP|nr:D-alanyl-glycyl endopeptidase-like protein [Trypanosoma theileri]ORC87237.1 D-alanyl-glycyl endopeptidase-like protein [Trypanosoma theileri]